MAANPRHLEKAFADARRFDRVVQLWQSTSEIWRLWAGRFFSGIARYMPRIAETLVIVDIDRTLSIDVAWVRIANSGLALVSNRSLAGETKRVIEKQILVGYNLTPDGDPRYRMPRRILSPNALLFDSI